MRAAALATAAIAMMSFMIAKCSAQSTESGPASTSAPRPAKTSAPAIGGSASEFELKVFGKYLQAGDSMSSVPDHAVTLAMLSATYNLSGQYRQVLRLCEYRESIAKNDVQRRAEKRCRRNALTNLGRYSEAEALAFEDDRWLSPDSTQNAVQQAQDWTVAAILSLNQGNPVLAQHAFAKVVQITIDERQSIASQQSMGRQFNAELDKSLKDDQLTILRDSEIGAFHNLAILAYMQQDFAVYESHVRRLLTTLENADTSTWATYAIEHATRLQHIGRVYWARELALRALPELRADAGFRDQAEPLTRFETNPAISAALGDERTQGIHVTGWLRLATAYGLAGRDAEEEGLLAGTEGIARRYVLEPEDANTLLANVEEARAYLAIRRDAWDDAIELLRRARSRLKNAAATERSLELGRRQLAMDSPMLRIDAQLVSALTKGGRMVFAGTTHLAELSDVASDFSASRADLSAQLASRSTQVFDESSKRAIVREGQLVDELVELRGQLAGILMARSQASESERSATANRLAAVNGELRGLKAAIAGGAPGSNANSDHADRIRAQLGTGAAYWQWISHPYGNFTLCWTANGIGVAANKLSYQMTRALATALQAKTSLRDVTYLQGLPPFPNALARQLYDELFGQLVVGAAGTTQWYLAASPLVDGIPWGALRLPASGSLSAPKWLMERVALTVVPSWRAWLSLAERRRSEGKMALLSIGNPTNSQRPVALGSLAKRGLFAAKALDSPEVTTTQDSAFSEEMSSLSALYSPGTRTVLSGPKATKVELSKLHLADYRIIAFSTHGYLARSLALTIGPSLELTATTGLPTDRFLTASEIAQYRLDADVVVLSACDTLAPDGYSNSEGMSGLTSAFLLAGSRSVLASLWPVETEATKFLVTRTLRYYADDQGHHLASALQRASLELMRSKDMQRQHPAFWSAFLVVGN